MKSFRQFITEAIDTRSYMRGRCAIFAMALHLEKGYPLGVLWDLNEDGDRDYMAMGEVDDDAFVQFAKDNDDWFPDDQSAVIHVFCYKTPTVLVDAKGCTTERGMLQNFNHQPEVDGLDPEFEQTDREEVEEFMKPQSPSNPHGGMLAPKPGEIDKLRQHIKENPDLY